MAPPQKRSHDRQDGSSSQQAKKPRTAAAPAPAFTSTLQHEEVDFPRGGGTSLTALEMKETMLEGRKMADMEVEQEAEGAKKDRTKKVGKREVARRKKENDLEKQKEWDKDKIRELIVCCRQSRADVARCRATQLQGWSSLLCCVN